MVDNKWSVFAAMEPAEAPLREVVSKFDDYWGTVVDFEHRMGEGEDEVTNPDTGEKEIVKRFYLQSVMLIQSEDGRDEYESFPLPTDPKTGEAQTDANGKPIPASKNSKWGIQAGMLDTIGIPWGGRVSGLIGLHAHFIRKGTRVTKEEVQKQKATGVRINRSDIPYGRYIVEWDFYNNDIRKQQGLQPITDKPNSKEEVKVEVVSEEEAVGAVAELADGKSFIALLSEIRTHHPELQPFATRDFIDGLVKSGVLSKKGATYTVVG